MNPVINNIKTTDGKLSFDITNVNVSFVNAIRRILLSEIKTPVFKTFPYHESNCNIISNTSRFNNEIIKQRLSCIPIHINDETINVNNLVVKLKIQNTGCDILYVTTEHFKIFDESTNNFLSPEITQQIFPKNKITNDYILFLKLQPPFIMNSAVKTNGEEIHLECRMSMDNAKTNSMFNVVSLATFGNIKQPKEILMGHYEKFKNNLLKTESYNDDELELLERDWYALNSQKYYIPDSFHFQVKTIGVFENKHLVHKAINILITKFKDMLEQTEVLLYEVIKNETFTEHSFNIILKNEDYTIGKIIEFLIFSKFVEHEKKCNFVSFKKAHPHDTDSLIILSYVESIEIPDILTDLNIIFNDSIKILETILSQIPM